MSFDFFFTQHFILPVLIKMQETVKAVWSSLVSSAGIAGLQLAIKRSLLYGIFLYHYPPIVIALQFAILSRYYFV